jgi:plasmid stabilization system protein ParE
MVYRPFVKEDLQNAVDYYKNISPKLAKEFLFRIKEAKNYIYNNPEADDIMYKEIRMHSLYQFPYHIHYFVDNKNEQIVVLAVAFSKREDLNFIRRQ